MIGALIGSMIGWRLGEKYLTPTSETPVWTGHMTGDLEKPAMSITRVRRRGTVSYRL